MTDRVLIVDDQPGTGPQLTSNQPSFATILATRFAELNVETWFIERPSVVRRVGASASGYSAIQGLDFLLVLAHESRRQYLLTDDAIHKLDVRIHRPVRYSSMAGTGWTDVSRQEFWIGYRGVSPLSPLSDTEIEDLLAWARGDETLLPAILRPRSENSTVASLAILCQGYLSAAYCAGELGSFDPGATACILLLEEVSRVLPSFRERLREAWLHGTVSSQHWWLSPFAEEDASSSRADPAVLVIRLRDLFDLEGKRVTVGSKLYRFLEVLSESAPIEDVKLVSGVYAELVESFR